MHENLESAIVVCQFEQSHDSNDGEELEISCCSESVVNEDVDVESEGSYDVDEINRSL